MAAGMLVLGIESSCDEAAAALVRGGREVLAEAVASQADDFAAWGGVVPEIAARGHVAAFPGLIHQVLDQAGLGIAAIDAVAVCAWPGLVGSLLAGVTAAKVVAARRRCPLHAVDHVQAHLAAIHLGRPLEAVPYPLVGLVASGGHSHVYLCAAPGSITLIGGTIDDAAGEAFDKVAAVLGLGYPGGPAVERAALAGNAQALALPRARPAGGHAGGNSLDLSFAGLKTAVLYHARGPVGRDPLRLDARGIADTCASFQAATAQALAGVLAEAGRRHGARALAAGGGVVCNNAVRAALAQAAEQLNVPLVLPAPRHCGDNAAMIAALGGFIAGPGTSLDFSPRPGRQSVAKAG